MRRLGPAGNSQVSSVRTPCVSVSVSWRWELSSERQLPGLPRVRLVPARLVVPVLVYALVCLWMQARAGPRTGSSSAVYPLEAWFGGLMIHSTQVRQISLGTASGLADSLGWPHRSKPTD